MPHWTLVFGLVIAAWLVVSVVGGFAVGRLLAFLASRLPAPRRTA